MGRTNRTNKLNNKLRAKTNGELETYANHLNDTYTSMLKLYLENPNPPQPHKDIKFLNNLRNKQELINKILEERPN